MEVSEAESSTRHDVDLDVNVEGGSEAGKEIDLEPEEKVQSPVLNSNSNHIPHDSMVTVRLSEPPPALHVDTNLQQKEIVQDKKELEFDTPGILLEEAEEDIEDSPRITLVNPNGNEVLSPSGSESPASRIDRFSRRDSDSSEGSMEGGGVNWEELEKTEEQEPRSENSDDVSICHNSIQSNSIE
jgi:hypothetical protein